MANVLAKYADPKAAAAAFETATSEFFANPHLIAGLWVENGRFVPDQIYYLARWRNAAFAAREHMRAQVQIAEEHEEAPEFHKQITPLLETAELIYSRSHSCLCKLGDDTRIPAGARQLARQAVTQHTGINPWNLAGRIISGFVRGVSRTAR